MSLGSWTIIIAMLCCLGIGQMLYEKYQGSYDIYNFTSEIRWDSISMTPVILSNVSDNFNVNSSKISNIHLQKIIYKGVDAFGFIFFEFAKWGIELGYEHPEMNYARMAKIIVALLLLSMSLPLLLIIIALFYVIKDLGVWLISKRRLKNGNG